MAAGSATSHQSTPALNGAGTGGEGCIDCASPADPHLTVYTSEGASVHSGRTTALTDTSAPIWAETPVKGVPRNAFHLTRIAAVDGWWYAST